MLISAGTIGDIFYSFCFLKRSSFVFNVPKRYLTQHVLFTSPYYYYEFLLIFYSLSYYVSKLRLFFSLNFVCTITSTTLYTTTFIYMFCIHNVPLPYLSISFHLILISCLSPIQLPFSSTIASSWIFVLSNTTSVPSQVASWSPGLACSDQSPLLPSPLPVWSVVPLKSQLTWTSSACPPPTELRSVGQLKCGFIENFF